MIDRRQFLRRLLSGAVVLPVAGEIDWERLLWVPKPIITVPAWLLHPTLDEINAITMRTIMPGIVDNFFRCDSLMTILHNGRPMRFGSIPAGTYRPIPQNLDYKRPRRF